MSDRIAEMKRYAALLPALLMLASCGKVTGGKSAENIHQEVK